MNYIVFEDEVTIYWAKDLYEREKPIYKIFLNGKEIARTEKTHYSLVNLNNETEYKIKIESSNEDVGVLFSGIICTASSKKRIDVTCEPYNAIGDGITINTQALQRAIDDCTSADCVYIPEGVFLTGALNLHSNMELYIEKGGVLQGTSDLVDYLPKINSRFEGTEMLCYRSLINMGQLDKNDVYNCENVVIRGGGTIYGGGKLLADNIIAFETEQLKEFLNNNADYVASCENKNTIPGRSRGRLINMSNCKNVVICDLTLGFGPAWNIHMIYSSDIITFNCKIESSGVWNGDGWDPDSSENCTIFGTEFATHDDGIAIKSGKNPEGNIVNKPTRNIKIFDCFGRHGVAIGSEVSGGIDGVYIWDCSYCDSLGVTIKTTTKRGGYIKNIKVNDCTMAGVAIMTNLEYNNDGEAAETVTELKNFEFKNLVLYAECINRTGERCLQSPIFIDGFNDNKNFVENVQFSDIKIIRKNDNDVKALDVSGTREFSIRDIQDVVENNHGGNLLRER